MTAATSLVGCGGSDLVLPNEGVPARVDIVGGNAQTATVSAALPESLVVRVLDSRDRPVVGQRVDFTAAAGSGVLTPASPTTDADGLAAAQWVLGATAGAQSATARPVGNGAPASLVAAFTAAATASRAAAVEIVAGNGQTATAGGAVPVAPAVRVLDGEGNRVAGVPVGFAVTGGGGAVNPATPVTTGADGVAAATSWTLGPTAGANTLTATVPGTGVTGNPATFTATGEAGSAGRLTIERQPPANAQSGSAFSPSVQVQLQDQNGNDVRQAGVAITADIASGPQGGELSGDIAQTSNSGLASFNALTLIGPAGIYTINFSGTNLTGVTSTPVTLGAGGAARLAFAVQPAGSASSGVALVTQPRVQVQDAAGNAVAQPGITVTVSITAQPGGGSLSGNTATTDASGAASFSSLTISGPTGTYTLLFAAPGVTGVTADVSLGAGNVSGSRSSWTLAPKTITAGDGVGPGEEATVSIVARDASGNAVQGAAAAVTVAPSQGVTVSQPAPTSAGGATSVTIRSTAAGSKTVTVTINGVPITNPVSDNLTVQPGPVSATTSTTVQAPALGRLPFVGETFGVLVTVKDQFGNLIQGSSVTLASTSGGAAAITPASRTTDGAGTASFSVTYATAGPKQLRATAGGVLLSSLGVTVQPGATTTSLASDKPRPNVGENVKFTATVSVTAPAEGEPGGNVVFRDDGAPIPGGTVPLNGGKAEFTTNQLEAGTHSITARYEGDGNFGTSTSAAIQQVVNGAPTAMPDDFQVLEDAQLSGNVLGNDTDPNGDPLTANVNDSPDHADAFSFNQGSGSFTYRAQADYNGADQFSYVADDGPLSSAPATVGISITPVNDAPSFTKGPDQQAVATEGPQTVANWATDIRAGPANESGQTVSFLVENDTPLAFSVQPAIDGAGTLTYTPSVLVLVETEVLVTVQVQDDGGTGDGGVNTSLVQTFTITIMPLLQ
ncbi:MAG: Ig-like domain-containing protein [Gemmatimonadales bacterium]